MMDKEILQLEKDLFKHEKISDINWLNNTIDDNFVECGKSGILFNKKETIEDLSKCTKDRDITIYNYTYSQIDNNTYLVHYVTNSNNEYYYRTSIWINNNGLKLLFHQASKLNDDLLTKIN